MIDFTDKIMEFYISLQSGQFYMINVLENQWLSVTYTHVTFWNGNTRITTTISWLQVSDKEIVK